MLRHHPCRIFGKKVFEKVMTYYFVAKKKNPFVEMFLVQLVLLLSAARLNFSTLFVLFCEVSCRRQTLFRLVIC